MPTFLILSSAVSFINGFSVENSNNTTIHILLNKDNPVVNKLRKLRVNAADFEMVKVIGRGHFGQVHLAKEKQTGDIYAMKVIKKSDILAKQNVSKQECQANYCRCNNV